MARGDGDRRARGPLAHRRGAAIAGATRRHAAVVALALVLAACGGAADPETEEDGAGTITFLSIHTQEERMERTRQSLERFEEQTGISVELTAVEASEQFSYMLAQAAAGTLPDVVAHPATVTGRWVSQGLLDPEAAAEVVAALGEDTFYPNALDAMRVDDQVAAVPSDGFSFITHYRRDWFDEAGLEEPRTFDDVLDAAETLYDPARNRYGITLVNDPGAEATHQRFEHYAVANGCRLADEQGDITLDSPECVEALEFDAALQEFAPPGVHDSNEARAFYLSGQAAISIETPVTLGRIAGLEDRHLPTCEECRDNPAYLAENTGFVTTLEGPSGSPTAYGQVRGFGISSDADTEAATALVEYLMSDGYVEWVAQAPSLLIPARPGDGDDPERFLDEWRTLNVGVEREGILDDIYGPETVDVILGGGPNEFDTWVFQHDMLAGAMLETFVAPRALEQVRDGVLTTEEAAAWMAEEATRLLD